jgi:hypothetical protein
MVSAAPAVMTTGPAVTAMATVMALVAAAGLPSILPAHRRQ